MRFTARAIEALKPGSARREFADDLLPGLYLVLQPSGAKSWSCRYRRAEDGKPRKLTLGAYPLIGLSDARDKARLALRAATEGADPAGEKQRRRGEHDATDSRLFEDALERFLVRGCAQHRTQGETRRLLTREVLPHWRGRSIDAIARADVTDVLYRLVDRQTLIQANRCYSRLRRLFNWCVETGLLDKSPMQGLRRPANEAERERVLSDDELRRVWQAADDLGWPFGPYVRLLVLTGLRRDELALATWQQIDLEAATLTVPGIRMKNGETHTVPLSPLAVAILADVPRFVGCEFVFTAHPPKPIAGFSKMKSRLDRLAGATSWTLHDLRRTVATGMARLGVPPHVADRVLAHKQGTIRGVAAIYNRYSYLDECRQALAQWAVYVESLGSAKVVLLAARRG